MKKLFSILVITLFVLGLCSCTLFNPKEEPQPEPEHTTHVDANGDAICDECGINLKLATPVVVVNEEGLASWAAVEGAQSYVYKLNGSEMGTMRLNLQLADGDVLQVKAIASAPYADSEYSSEVTYTAPVVLVYGLPQPEEGFFMRDADVIQDGSDRYLVYLTNKTKASEDNVIAICKGELTEQGWLYGEQQIILEASEAGWDQYLGSASIVKGEFALAGEQYHYLLAYQGTTSSNGVANQIGFAVAADIMGPYVKVGTAPVVAYDAAVYGANMVGCYAPSLINYNKVSGIRLFYTLADAYGHFAYFMDFDLSDLSNIHGVKAMVTNKGALQGGDAVTMFPNADFAYDATNQKFIAVKDVSPSPALKPSFADEFELCFIAEEELYTTDEGEGWISMDYQDFFDLEVNRAYSACIVSDMYGHILAGDFEIIFNDCETGNEYLFTQHFVSYFSEEN